MSRRDPLLVKVRDSVRELIDPGAPCLAAVSGGPDSVALVAALCELSDELPMELAVAHLDHAIRERSAADAEWVGDLAARLELPFICERLDVPSLKRREGLALEEAARRARYAFLERAALEWGARCVFTGHTADDQAETVLFRVLRGTGLTGLAGIPRARPISAENPEIVLVRPMLGCTRLEVLTFLESRGLDSLVDETNFDVAGQARARIRHELLPALSENWNPELSAALNRLASSARQAQEALEETAADRLERAGPWIEAGGAELRLPLALLEAPQALRVEILAICASRLGLGAGPDRAHLAGAARELPGAKVGKIYELGGLIAVRDYEHVVLRPAAKTERPAAGWEVEVRVPGVTPLPGGELRAERIGSPELDMDEFSLTKTAYQEVFDARVLDRGDGLTCRTRRPGDRFHPLGAAGECKLKEFFINEKVPQRDRDSVPLLVLGGRILWVVGHRLSERARVSDGAMELVSFSFRRR
ncbi:MAG: tRNA lysidine(34) synthetase TilS [Planctomycetota bacterium]